jgi:hypothetical protein
MIASGSPKSTSANAPPTIVSTMCIPECIFVAGRVGYLWSKNCAREQIQAARQFDRGNWTSYAFVRAKVADCALGKFGRANDLLLPWLSLAELSAKARTVAPNQKRHENHRFVRVWSAAHPFDPSEGSDEGAKESREHAFKLGTRAQITSEQKRNVLHAVTNFGTETL